MDHSLLYRSCEIIDNLCKLTLFSHDHQLQIPFILGVSIFLMDNRCVWRQGYYILYVTITLKKSYSTLGVGVGGRGRKDKKHQEKKHGKRKIMLLFLWCVWILHQISVSVQTSSICVQQKEWTFCRSSC